MNTAYELALKYYPKMWNDERLEALKEKGLLTDDEIQQIKSNVK